MLPLLWFCPLLPFFLTPYQMNRRLLMFQLLILMLIINMLLFS